MVALSALATVLPFASAGTIPSCASVTDASATEDAAGFYVSNTDGWSVWSEANNVLGLQTQDCVDAGGHFHHADVEQFATSGSKSATCLTGTFCTFT